MSVSGDFFTAVLKALERLHGTRNLEENFLRHLIEKLGTIEWNYLALSEYVPFSLVDSDGLRARPLRVRVAITPADEERPVLYHDTPLLFALRRALEDNLLRIDDHKPEVLKGRSPRDSGDTPAPRRFAIPPEVWEESRAWRETRQVTIRVFDIEEIPTVR